MSRVSNTPNYNCSIDLLLGVRRRSNPTLKSSPSDDTRFDANLGNANMEYEKGVITDRVMLYASMSWDNDYYTITE